MRMKLCSFLAVALLLAASVPVQAAPQFTERQQARVTPTVRVVNSVAPAAFKKMHSITRTAPYTSPCPCR